MNTNSRIKKKISKINENFWKGKKVFITGNTGFKGSWLTIWLIHLGAHVIGYSKDKKDNYFFKKVKYNKKIKFIKGDVNNYTKLENIIKNKPEIIIHLAAQSLYGSSIKKSFETLDTNINGTINILEISKKLKILNQ